MNYFLFKLQFETAVHFGSSDAALSLATSEEHVRADTLFSALCQTALCLYGPEGAEELCGQVQEGKLLLSDTMPWRGDTLFLPKPVTPVETEQDLPSDQKKKRKKHGRARRSKKRKKPLTSLFGFMTHKKFMKMLQRHGSRMRPCAMILRH